MAHGKFRVSKICVPISKSRNLVFLCFFASRIFEFWPRGLGVSDVCFNGFDIDQNYDESVYLIKSVRRFAVMA